MIESQRSRLEQKPEYFSSPTDENRGPNSLLTYCYITPPSLVAVVAPAIWIANASLLMSRLAEGINELPSYVGQFGPLAMSSGHPIPWPGSSTHPLREYDGEALKIGAPD